MHRRNFLIASSAAVGLTALQCRVARAEPDNIGETAPFPLEAGQPVPTLDELLQREQMVRGIETPYQAEVEKAKQILAACPNKQNPMQIAQFFQDLRQGELNATLGAGSHLYGEEWPQRANPIIVSFFDATTLRTPNGDQTAWCAAFVNWCIGRGREGRPDAAGLLPYTASAASESFRKWGQATDTPMPGDIVVFQHKREAWRGHVAFFISKMGDGIYVLGGNQMPTRAKLPDGTYERRNTGEVNISRMRINGADLKLHSYRTDRSLHDIDPV